MQRSAALGGPPPLLHWRFYLLVYDTVVSKELHLRIHSMAGRLCSTEKVLGQAQSLVGHQSICGIDSIDCVLQLDSLLFTALP